MPLQGVEFQALLFLIVCRNAVPDADLKIKVGGGGAPLDSPLEVLGFSCRIGYYIHWNLSNGMKITVSIFFPYLQLAAKLLKPCPSKGTCNLENKTIHICLLPPSIPSLGVCCCLQVARTAAQHCMEGMEEGKLYFLIFKKCLN